MSSHPRSGDEKEAPQVDEVGETSLVEQLRDGSLLNAVVAGVLGLVAGTAVWATATFDILSIDALSTFGQVVLGGFFVLGGLNQLFDADRLARWTAAKGLPFATVLVYVGGVAVLLGGAAVVVDPFIAADTLVIGVAVLVALLVMITLTMHNFWRMAESEGIYPVEAPDGGEAYMLPPQPTELFSFLRNVALIGALLALL